MPKTEQSGDTERVQEGKGETLHSAHYMPYCVLTVGTEQAVLKLDSPVRNRIFAYGKFFQSMHIILLSSATGSAIERQENITVYPTNSRAKILRYFDAVRIGKSVAHVDIVSAQDPFETAISAWLIARYHRAPLHVQVHTDFLAPSFIAHSVLNRIRVLIAGFILRRASRIRAVSKNVRDSIIDTYKITKPVGILPIYVDLERFRTTQAPADLSQRFAQFTHRVLIVSRLESEKNVALAFEAFVKAAPRTACLIILGSGSERAALAAAATRSASEDRIFFEGYIDPAPYYALADLVLFPSHYDGYGQVIIEALAAGKPVLSTNVGIATESGAIVSAPEVFDLALKEWFANGDRVGVLKNYPYSSLGEYVRKYCEDIAASK